MNYSCRQFALICVLMLSLGSVSLVAETWVTSPSHRVMRNEVSPGKTSLFNPADKTIALYTAKNEFVAFQFVFGGAASGVDVVTEEFKGAGSARLSKPLCFHEHYMHHPAVSQLEKDQYPSDGMYMEAKRIKLGAPREYPVQMVPHGATKYGFPFDVKAGANEVVWCEVFIPEDAAAGKYTSQIKAGGETFTVALEVWDFALPSVSHFPQWVYVGPETIAYSFGKTPGEIRNMMPIFDGYFQMAHDHRISLMEFQENGPGYFKAEDRKFYDYYTGEAFKGPFGAGFGYELLPIASDASQWMPLLKEKNWLNRAFRSLGDEPGSKEAYQEVIKHGTQSHVESGGQLRRMITEQYVPSKADWPHLDPAVDIFCSGSVAPFEIADVEKAGNVVWTYNGGHAGSALTDIPGPALRTHAWAGFVSGARAWYFWEGVYVVDKHNKWKNERKSIKKNPSKYLTDVWHVSLNFDEATKPWKNGKLYPADWSLRLNGDGLLFYPGKDVGVDGPIACFRVKNLRQGAQDFEYLYLLEKMGMGKEARKIVYPLLGVLDGSNAESRDGQSAKRKYDYEKDALKWDEARIALGKLLDKIGDKKLKAKVNPYNQFPNPVGHPDFYEGKRY